MIYQIHKFTLCKIIIFCLSFWNSYAEFGENSSPIVTIKDGTLKGFEMWTADKKRRIEAFQGIPFARAPVGNLRFRDPVKNLPWFGIRDAGKESPQCIQLDPMRNWTVHGQEDCLYLNVYRPKRKIHEEFLDLLPVLVWIHGGAFFFGSGSIYGPAYLLERDVILVTFNYRLGPFGFLSTGDEACTGNQGLKDQLLALKWVQENISAFKGNPNSVTIFGQSAGGASVHHHMMSPLTQGLFQRAISQSGSAFCHWAIKENSAETTKLVGNILNCKGSSQEIVDCLRTLDANQIAPIQQKLFEWNTFPDTFFGPVVEHSHPGAFLLETPEQSYKSRRVSRIPWITGFTKNEGGWFVPGLLQNESSVNEINSDWDRLAPIMLALKSGKGNARKIWDFYMGQERLSFRTRQKFVDLFGDRYFTTCGLEALRYHSKFTGAPTYAYQFNFEGKYTVFQRNGENPKDWGAVHLDDLVYLLNNTDYYATIKPSDKEEMEMKEIMTSLWTNFATFGHPYLSLSKGPTITRDVWEPIQNIGSRYSPLEILSLNLTPKMIADPYRDRYTLWKRLDLIDC